MKKIFVLFILSVMFLGPSLVFAEITETEIEPGEPEVVIPSTIEDKITIRNGETIIYDGKILFPETEEMISILGQEVSNKSVFGLLYTLDQGDASFSISNLSYNESFGAFLLNCITPGGSEELCYEWQYVVDGYYPNIGMDKNILSGGENIYLFFGQTDRILLSASSIDKSEDLTISTEKYDFENNQWLVKTGVTVGITKVNPDDPYNPIEIQSGMVDENGQKVFSTIPIGPYSAGIRVDDNGFSYYWPTVNFEVVESSSGGNNGGGGSTPELFFSIQKAISFLLANQNADGSFQNDMYTDWVAIASASSDEADLLKSKIHDHVINNEFESSIITDYERHIMAMMSLGINPYNETNIDYIKKITDAFDGQQIGDDSLINDDIFGLIVLAHAGFSKNDEIIKKVVAYIIREQSADGSWESIDLTSSAIQALWNFKNLNEVSETIEKAGLYLLAEQNDDGGFDNSFSTSWAVQALALDSSYETEVEKAILYLANQQKEDGGLDDGAIESRVWSTAYAIPAVLKMSWNDILESFDKEEIITPQEDEETVEKEDTLVELIEAPVQVEIPIEKITIDNQDIKNLKNNLVVEKKEEKNVIDEKKEVNNALLASAGGVFIEKDESPNLFFQKLNNFFQRLFSYFRAFRFRLLSGE